MGEAKRRAELGPTRRIRVSRIEVVEFINYLLRPDEQGRPRKSIKGERKSLKRAVKQIGAKPLWDLVKLGKRVEESEIEAVVPEEQVTEITVETIDFVLQYIAETDVRSGLVLVDLEEKLEEAKAGIGLVGEDGEDVVATVTDLPMPAEV